MTAQYLCSKLDALVLHPIREAGRVWYEESDVEQALVKWKRKNLPHKKTPAKYSGAERIERGRVAAHVFLILSEGGTYHECVMITQADPEMVREFYDDFHTTPEDRAALRAMDDHAAWVAERNAQREREELLRRRVAIREVLAEADAIRAKQGEPQSETMKSWATRTWDGLPALERMQRPSPPSLDPSTRARGDAPKK